MLKYVYRSQYLAYGRGLKCRYESKQAVVLTRFFSILAISLAVAIAGNGQEPVVLNDSISAKDLSRPAIETRMGRSGNAESWLAEYSDPIQGSSSNDLVRRAFSSNAELAAVRLEIARARARLIQAGLRPNPSFDVEQQNGVFNSPGERATALGISIPLELAGQRGRRIDLARAELEAAEAEVADRERRLASEVRSLYAEALAALRELEVTRSINTLDAETARIIQVRVEEGDSAPLELNLMRAEVDRLRARRALLEGRLQAAYLRLRQFAGIPLAETLRLRGDLSSPVLFEPPASLDVALEIALRYRPDLRLARLNEEVAQAGYRLARVQSAPQVTAFARYTNNLSSFDNTPIGVLQDRDKLLSFGVSITLPILNRNQGGKVEAQLAVTQAQRRREFIESAVRADVASAYRRYEAAEASLRTYEQGVIARSTQNVSIVRAAYETGAFRISELLAEQRRLIDSQREVTDALAERYRARADLQAALGAVDQQ
jgi:outer membrane protein, heavy metal efflux system